MIQRWRRFDIMIHHRYATLLSLLRLANMSGCFAASRHYYFHMPLMLPQHEIRLIAATPPRLRSTPLRHRRQISMPAVTRLPLRYAALRTRYFRYMRMAAKRATLMLLPL